MMKQVLPLFLIITFSASLVRTQCLKFDTAAVFGGKGDDLLNSFAADADKSVYFFAQTYDTIEIGSSVFQRDFGHQVLRPHFIVKMEGLNKNKWHFSFETVQQARLNSLDMLNGKVMVNYSANYNKIGGEPVWTNDASGILLIVDDSGNKEELIFEWESLFHTGVFIDDHKFFYTYSYHSPSSSNNPRGPFDFLRFFDGDTSNTHQLIHHKWERPVGAHPRHPYFRIYDLQKFTDSTVIFVGQLTISENAEVAIAGDTFNVELRGWPYPGESANYRIMAEVNTTGRILRYKLLESPATYGIEHLAIDRDRNIYLTGHFHNTESFGYGIYTANNQDIFIAKFDSVFDWKGIRQITGEGRLRPTGITIHESGDYGYLTGDFEREIYFDEKYISPDSNNAFVARFSADLDWEAVNFIEGEGEVHSRGVDFYDEDRIVVGVNFTKTVRTDDEKYASAGASDFMFTVMSYDENCEGPFSTEDVSLSTLDLTLYPNPAANGEFRVRCGVGIESAVFYTLNGAEVPAQLSGRGGEELTVRVLTDKKQMIIGRFVDKNGNTEVRKIVVNP